MQHCGDGGYVVAGKHTGRISIRNKYAGLKLDGVDHIIP